MFPREPQEELKNYMTWGKHVVRENGYLYTGCWVSGIWLLMAVLACCDVGSWWWGVGFI